MQIHDVPETISRKSMLGLFRELGFNPNAMRAAEFGLGGIWVEVVAPLPGTETDSTPNGQLEVGDTIAYHRVYVRYVD